MAVEIWVDAPAATDAANRLEAIQRHLEDTWKKLGPQIAAASNCLKVDGSPSNDIRANFQQAAGPLEQLLTANPANVGTLLTNLREVVKYFQAHDDEHANSMRRLNDDAGADSMRRA